MQQADIIRVRHMIDAAREASAFMRGRTRSDLDQNRLLALALTRLVEIIGEAAGKISPEASSQHLQIPWADIVGMRNRLVHGYFEVDLDRLWDTITDDLPALVTGLEEILRQER
mgnify:CR=1 FL=1